MTTPERDLTKHDDLGDFDARELTFLGKTKRVFVAGKGPAVIGLGQTRRRCTSVTVKC